MPVGSFKSVHRVHRWALVLRSMQRLDAEGGRVLAKKVIMFTDKQGRASEKLME